jgi:2-polyprenyl-6-hydroxyphenyl methylase/3-demethylubiquinone-9 3-methyltransferase
MGARFEFGENWARFLELLDDRRISDAEASLKEMLAVQHLRDQRFLDIGCGSGLFSLAARRLGATVHSFDYDPQSVACARELKRRYFPDDAAWRIETGSVLDARFLGNLGDFDVVYSWGVLHHTGAMWLALEHAISCVARKGGRLFIAIYADQGWKSHAWWFVKLIYNRLPRVLRPVYMHVVSALVRIVVILKYTILLRPMTTISLPFGDRRERGMSVKHDRLDWIGGFPYEFATLETLIAFLEARGFSLVTTRRAGSLGCHELVARRIPCAE